MPLSKAYLKSFAPQSHCAKSMASATKISPQPCQFRSVPYARASSGRATSSTVSCAEFTIAGWVAKAQSVEPPAIADKVRLDGSLSPGLGYGSRQLADEK